MCPSEALEHHREDIRRIVAAHRAANPRVFGSALHGDDDEDSDLDILVDALDGASVFDIVRVKSALEDLKRVRMDVGTPEELHERFRASVVNEAAAV